MIVNLEHRGKLGEVTKESFNIDFVSSWMTDKFFEIEQSALEYLTMMDSLPGLNAMAASLRHKREALKLDVDSETNAAAIEEIGNELTPIQDKIRNAVERQASQSPEYFSGERFKVMCEILTKNGYADRVEFFDRDFWKRNVSGNAMANFICECVTEKKKAMMPRKKR